VCAKQLDRRIVSFDAAGTLLALREEVGETYSRLAARHGYVAAPGVVEAAFRRTFPLREPLIDQSRERAWWKNVVRDAFDGASTFSRFDEFFDETYEFFSHASAWQLFEDVSPVLRSLKDRGCRLVVISNFDSRLSGLLAELGVSEFLDGIFVSSCMGAAKPDPAIFEKALSRLSAETNGATHVGDSWGDDVKGAAGAGMQSVWLNRHGSKASPTDPRISSITTLFELPALLF
jgi:putative hydrolase of the HAD superfamily